MLNEEMLDKDAVIDYEKVSRWKEIELLFPEKITSASDMVIINPEAREDYKIELQRRGTKKRLAGKVTFANPNKKGYVALTLAADDYGRYERKAAKFGDMFIIERDENRVTVEYRKHGETRQHMDLGHHGDTLEFIIEKFPNKTMFLVADHAILEREPYISPSANFELWISATTPVAIDNFRGYYEIGGKWQNPVLCI